MQRIQQTNTHTHLEELWMCNCLVLLGKWSTATHLMRCVGAGVERRKRRRGSRGTENTIAAELPLAIVCTSARTHIHNHIPPWIVG